MKKEKTTVKKIANASNQEKGGDSPSQLIDARIKALIRAAVALNTSVQKTARPVRSQKKAKSG